MLENILERIAVSMEKLVVIMEIKANPIASEKVQEQPINSAPIQQQPQVQPTQQSQTMPQVQPIQQSQPIQQPPVVTQQPMPNQITTAPVKEYTMQELAIAGRDLYMKNPQRLLLYCRTLESKL